MGIHSAVGRENLSGTNAALDPWSLENDGDTFLISNKLYFEH